MAIKAQALISTLKNLTERGDSIGAGALCREMIEAGQHVSRCENFLKKQHRKKKPKEVQEFGKAFVKFSESYSRESYNEALLWSKAMTEKFPHFSLSWRAMGLVLFKQRNFKLAESTFLKAISINPLDKTSNEHLLASCVFVRNVDLAEKIAATIQEHWGLTDIYISNMLEIYAATGNHSKEIAFLHKILPYAQNKSFVVNRLIDLEKHDADSNFFKLASDALKKEGDNHRVRADWHYAIHKLHENSTDHQGAAQNLKLMLEELQHISKYNHKQHLETFLQAQRLTGKADPFLFDRAQFLPVFIVGLPRSGTTLLEQVISEHPDVTDCGELEYFRESVIQANVTAVDDAELISKIRSQYLSKTFAIGRNKILIDKMPHNFRQIGLIRSALPEAKIIHARRDLRAVALSTIKAKFPSVGLQYGYSLDDTIDQFKFYLNAMEYWDRIECRIFNVDYESLVSKPKDIFPLIFSHIGIDFKAEYLNFYSSEKLAFTASRDQVRAGVHTESAERWKLYSPYFSDFFKTLGAMEAERKRSV